MEKQNKLKITRLSGYTPEQIKYFDGIGSLFRLMQKGFTHAKPLMVCMLFLLFASMASAQDIPKKYEDQIREVHVGGFTRVPRERVDQSYNAGYSFYTAAWPLLKEYPGRSYQSGLFGTWMHPQHDKPSPIDRLYSDIEGGLGWWRDKRFLTETPKFIMGGVQLNFAGWANGPGAGKGRDWDNPKGKYGVAQLSPWVLFPPDGLNLKEGTCGELFGYGYHPLPLTEPKETTAGKDVPTGNQCWTLFLNTANFKGPLAFFTPYFWSKAPAEDPRLSGMFFDTLPARANKPVSMETQHIPAAEASDSKGQKYIRVAPTLYPVDSDGITVLMNRHVVYNKKALWGDVEEWFDGGDPVDGAFNPEGSYMQEFPGNVRAGWTIWGDHITDENRAGLNLNIYFDAKPSDAETCRLSWDIDSDLIKKRKTKNGTVVILPEYYIRENNSGNGKDKWIAIAPEKVPAETGLHEVSFHTPDRESPEPYVTPDEEESCWKKPGPAAGPFKAKLGDGSTITYYWYRFADQPAMLNADMTKAEREEMQRRVELLHRNWTKDREYLPPPTVGELANIDPALIVTPPKGMEVGYVPIVTKQGME